MVFLEKMFHVKHWEAEGSVSEGMPVGLESLRFGFMARMLRAAGAGRSLDLSGTGCAVWVGREVPVDRLFQRRHGRPGEIWPGAALHMI